LAIDAGVVLIFAQYTSLIVDGGVLFVNGTATSPVNFQKSQDGNNWASIIFTENSESQYLQADLTLGIPPTYISGSMLKYLTINGAGQTSTQNDFPAIFVGSKQHAPLMWGLSVFSNYQIIRARSSCTLYLFQCNLFSYNDYEVVLLRPPTSSNVQLMGATLIVQYVTFVHGVSCESCAATVIQHCTLDMTQYSWFGINIRSDDTDYNTFLLEDSDFNPYYGNVQVYSAYNNFVGKFSSVIIRRSSFQATSGWNGMYFDLSFQSLIMVSWISKATTWPTIPLTLALLTWL